LAAVIYALRTPAVLLGIALGFLAAGALRAAALAGLSRGRAAVGSALRGWRTWLDPFGVVAVIISGVGWVGTADRFRAKRDLAVDLVVHFGLAAAALAGFATVRGSRFDVAVLGQAIGLSNVLHGGLQGAALSFLASVCAGAGMINLGCGLLALVPIPPLAMGVLVWSRPKRSPQARRFAYHLLEEHWGIALVLVLVLLPVSNNQSPLLALVDTVGDALLRLAG
jgi:hypothetical protein